MQNMDMLAGCTNTVVIMEILAFLRYEYLPDVNLLIQQLTSGMESLPMKQSRARVSTW